MHPDFDLIIASVNIPGLSGPRMHPNRLPKDGNLPPWANPNLSVDGIVEPYKQINDYKPVLGLLQDRSANPKESNDPQTEKLWKIADDVAGKLIELKIPYYPTVSRAAVAANKVISYYQMRQSY